MTNCSTKSETWNTITQYLDAKMLSCWKFDLLLLLFTRQQDVMTRQSLLYRCGQAFALDNVTLDCT